MDAAPRRRRTAVIAALVVVLAVAAVWASIALAGGSGSPAKAPSAKQPAAGQVAKAKAARTPKVKRHDGGQCPFRGDQTAETSDL